MRCNPLLRLKGLLFLYVWTTSTALLLSSCFVGVEGFASLGLSRRVVSQGQLGNRLSSVPSKTVVPMFGGSSKTGQRNGPLTFATYTRLRRPTSICTKLQLGVIPDLVWTCLLPPCLGWYKSFYTVSYGYGFAMALSALVVMRQLSLATSSSSSLLVPIYWLSIPFCHAAAVFFYGVRLTIFLSIRSRQSTKIRQMIQDREDRALARGNRWTTRLPFIATSALLYGGLIAPIVASAACSWSSTPLVVQYLARGLVGLQWFGFLLAAIGDGTKTYVKSKEGEDYLVTSGIFALLRHPNYTGEIIGWTASGILGFIAAAMVQQSSSSSASSSSTWSIIIPLILNLVANGMGMFGILFVLLRATETLEAEQKDKYNSTTNPKYSKWISSTWSGWQLPSKKTKETLEELPEMVVSDVTEDMGTGI